MAELSWSEWYASIVKGSKTKEEELEKCREALKLLREVISDLLRSKPLFMEVLLEAMKDEGFDESQIEDALLDMLEMPFIFHLDSSLKLYVRWKDRIDFKKIDKALSALSYTVARKAVAEESILGKIKLNVLDRHLILTSMIIEGAVSVLLQGNPFSSGILLRSALETGLRGMLLEHLLNRKFRAKVEQESYPHKYYEDSVVKFLKDVSDKSRGLGAPIEDIIKTPEEFSVNSPKIYDVTRWLEEWNVFQPIPNVTKLIEQKYRKLSQEVHGKTLELYLRGAIAIAALDKLMEEITEIIDLILVGTLNTMRNLAPEKLTKLNTEWWREFTALVKGGGLEHTGKRLTSW